MDIVRKRSLSPRNIRKDESLRRPRSYSSEDEESVGFRADLEALTNLASPFNEPNVAFVFEERKLYVEREQLIAVSPVFEAMFSSKFNEGSEKQITLPGKNLNHFVRFLRYLCPGFDDELTEDTVHLMLPLADEYQTDDLKKRIERFLVNSVLCQPEFISSEQIILNILEAKLYKLSNYLDACIQVASRKMFDNLTKSPKFEEISQNTQLKISFKRWEDIDKIYEKAVKEKSQSKVPKQSTVATALRSLNQHESHLLEFGITIKPHMQEN